MRCRVHLLSCRNQWVAADWGWCAAILSSPVSDIFQVDTWVACFDRFNIKLL